MLDRSRSPTRTLSTSPGRASRARPTASSPRASAAAATTRRWPRISGTSPSTATPQHEQPNVHAEVQERQAAEEPIPDADAWTIAKPEEYQDANVVTLRSPARVAVGSDGKGRPERVVEFKAGARFAADSELVRASPDLFKGSGR